MLVYLRDGSTQTIVRVRGVTWKRVGMAVEGGDLEKKGTVDGVTWKRGGDCGRGDLEKKGMWKG